MNHKLSPRDLVYLRKGYYKEHKIGLKDELLLALPIDEQQRLMDLGKKPATFFESIDSSVGVMLAFILLIGGYVLFQLALGNKYFLWFVVIFGSPIFIILFIFIASKNR